MNRINNFLVLLLIIQFNFGQNSVELFGGHNQFQFESFLSGNLDLKKKLSIFSYVRFTVDYNDRKSNSSQISPQINYNISKNWGIVAGANFMDQLFVSKVGTFYSYLNNRSDLYINILPTLLVCNDLQYDLFGYLLYSPILKNKLNYFFRWSLVPLSMDSGMSTYLAISRLELELNLRMGFKQALE